MQIGIPTYYFPAVTSTNEVAAELIASKQPEEGTVITTDLQTAGKGQHNKDWHAATGLNVTMSIILRPTWMLVADQFGLNIISSLAVADTIAKITGMEATVKWPNDVYVGDKKIAGILIKNYVQGSRLKCSIVGIGLNVNQTTWHQGAANPTSISLIHQPTQVGDVQQELCAQLAGAYERLRLAPRAIKRDYINRLYRRDQKAMYSADDEQYVGVIRDVDPMGRLVIESEGAYRSYAHGEVQFVIGK